MSLLSHIKPEKHCTKALELVISLVRLLNGLFVIGDFRPTMHWSNFMVITPGSFLTSATVLCFQLEALSGCSKQIKTQVAIPAVLDTAALHGVLEEQHPLSPEGSYFVCWHPLEAPQSLQI